MDAKCSKAEDEAKRAVELEGKVGHGVTNVVTRACSTSVRKDQAFRILKVYHGAMCWYESAVLKRTLTVCIDHHCNIMGRPKEETRGFLRSVEELAHKQRHWTLLCEIWLQPVLCSNAMNSLAEGYNIGEP